VSTTTTRLHPLAVVATHWRHLEDALGTPSVASWPPSGLRAYLGNLGAEEEAEARAWKAEALRALERSPEQLGRTEPPLRLTVLETMTTVTDTLVDLADVTAAAVQRSPMSRAPRTWPAAERARRDLLAMEDAADPRRWRYTGPPRTAVQAALWLLAQQQGVRGPWRPLTEQQRHSIETTARHTAEQVERVLDLAARREPLAHPCDRCGGTIHIHGGSGVVPLAHCKKCGRIWTEQGIAA
jgi:hypothetical protein